MSALQNVGDIQNISSKRSSAYFNSNLYNELRKKGLGMNRMSVIAERPDSVLNEQITIQEEVSLIISKAKEESMRILDSQQTTNLNTSKTRTDSLFLPELESPKFNLKEKLVFFKSPKQKTESEKIPINRQKMREFDSMMQEGFKAAKESQETKTFHRILKHGVRKLPKISQNLSSNINGSMVHEGGISREFSLPLINNYRSINF